MHEFPIVFSSSGIPLVGTFFRNSDSLVKRQPCVIVSGSWLNVKEQMATTYARALAERGYTTLVYAFAGWGESGGALQHVEMPTAGGEKQLVWMEAWFDTKLGKGASR